MSKKIFISYSHKQSDWAVNDLKPVLVAGGSDVLIDTDRFKAGKAVKGQMDALQDQADLSLLVLTPDYLASDYCMHELRRAVDKDPDFKRGTTLPVFREVSPTPAELQGVDPVLYVNLRDPEDERAWANLLKSCDVNLNCAVPHWLAVRNQLVNYLDNGDSVNLVVKGKPAWRELFAHVRQDHLLDLGEVNFTSAKTNTRHGLVAEILSACKATGNVPPEPEDLAFLEREIEARPLTRLLFSNFDMVKHRDYANKYDLFSSIRFMISDKHKLVLLVQSKDYFNTFLPDNHPLSSITNMKLVELKGQA